MPSRPSSGTFRFGIYEADLSARELRKSGLRLRLQDQAFQVLVMLLDRPAQIVTREELREKLWPDGTFVDYDHGLNTIINKLREALSDTAANPKFVETLSRRGYRFIAPVQFDSGLPKTSSSQPADGVIPEASSTSLFTGLPALSAANRRRVRVLFLLLQIMYLSFYVVALARLRFIQDLLEQSISYGRMATTILILTAVIGIPLRLYLVSAVAFDLPALESKFRRLFPVALALDTVWAIAPFLLIPQIGVGLALASTAALAYSPFAQRALLMMAYRPESEL